MKPSANKISLPAIVIVAYNRPHCMQRLLTSVIEAKYAATDIPIIISIDKSNEQEIYAQAEKCNWKYGEKIIIRHSVHLGLKQHLLRCGDLAEEYGSVIVLEDDLLVSPYFYSYALDALNFYNNDERIAGISLFNYQVSENRFFPFYPIQDGSDVYFIQVASSWGQLITVERWTEFRNWLKDNDVDATSPDIPDYQQQWSQHSWKKRLNRFLIEKKKFFVFPRIGLSTNFGEPGVNTDRRGLFQTQLLEGEKKFHFASLHQSKAIYDAWFEIMPIALNQFCTELEPYSYTVDLHGTKEPVTIKTPFLLSSRPHHQPLFSYANDMAGIEENIVKRVKGAFFNFGATTGFGPGSDFDLANYYTGLNTIMDIVCATHIQKVTAKFVQDFLFKFKFNQQYPLLFIGIICNGDAGQLKTTIDSVEAQLYPESQISLKIFSKTGNTPDLRCLYPVELISFQNDLECFQILNTSIDNSEAVYYIVLNSGEKFCDNTFHLVNKIFHRYLDINWITGADAADEIDADNGERNVASSRWNEHIFTNSLSENPAHYISAGSTFWKRYAWDAAKSHLEFVPGLGTFNSLWQALFKKEQLYTADYIFSSGEIQDKHGRLLLEKGIIDRWQEYFFIKNVTYLRMFYKRKNEMPPVIRFNHKTQSYYLSDY